jgi:hypothetical protein
MSTTKYVANELRELSTELDSPYLERLAEQLDPTYHAYGVIVKANKDNGRFKDTSVWVSLGDGTYKHLSGEKGLVATYGRLNGFVHKVYAV